MSKPTPQAAAIALATQFHEIYERLAPQFGYETRKETRAFDTETPNGRLMIAVCEHIMVSRIRLLVEALKEADNGVVRMLQISESIRPDLGPTECIRRCEERFKVYDETRGVISKALATAGEKISTKGGDEPLAHTEHPSSSATTGNIAPNAAATTVCASESAGTVQPAPGADEHWLCNVLKETAEEVRSLPEWLKPDAKRADSEGNGATPEKRSPVTDLRRKMSGTPWTIELKDITAAISFLEAERNYERARLINTQSDLTAALAEMEKEKSRADNHWETLRSIRELARTSGDLSRIILWVNDAGSGYVESAENTHARLQDEVNDLSAELAKVKAERDKEIARLDHALAQNKEVNKLKVGNFYLAETRKGIDASLT